MSAVPQSARTYAAVTAIVLGVDALVWIVLAIAK
jgi:hypothetical protein